MTTNYDNWFDSLLRTAQAAIDKTEPPPTGALTLISNTKESK